MPSSGRMQEPDTVRFGELEPLDRVYLDCEPGGDVLFCPGTPVGAFRLSAQRPFNCCSGCCHFVRLGTLALMHAAVAAW